MSPIRCWHVCILNMCNRMWVDLTVFTVKTEMLSLIALLSCTSSSCSSTFAASHFLVRSFHVSIYLSNARPANCLTRTLALLFLLHLSVFRSPLPRKRVSVTSVIQIPSGLVVNTVGAVMVMYGCNPAAAVCHGCQFLWETRWFIFCSSAYGLI